MKKRVTEAGAFILTVSVGSLARCLVSLLTQNTQISFLYTDTVLELPEQQSGSTGEDYNIEESRTTKRLTTFLRTCEKLENFLLVLQNVISG
ncbi:hypothetical protein JTB14_022083 [Gonioctena quinquepunctata]|nr:hypothetical protein JTB14_022083 [Gonioctena quinquepunctata]